MTVNVLIFLVIALMIYAGYLFVALQSQKKERIAAEHVRDAFQRESERVYQLLAVSKARYEELKSMLSKIGSSK